MLSTAKKETHQQRTTVFPAALQPAPNRPTTYATACDRLSSEPPEQNHAVPYRDELELAGRDSIGMTMHRRRMLCGERRPLECQGPTPTGGFRGAGEAATAGRRREECVTQRGRKALHAARALTGALRRLGPATNGRRPPTAQSVSWKW